MVLPQLTQPMPLDLFLFRAGRLPLLGRVSVAFGLRDRGDFFAQQSGHVTDTTEQLICKPGR